MCRENRVSDVRFHGTIKRLTTKDPALTNARRQLQSTRALGGQLRATENVLEHFVQVVLSLVVLTTPGLRQKDPTRDGVYSINTYSYHN